MAPVEWIKKGDEVLALVIRTAYLPDTTHFLTPPDHKLQMGFIVYGAGSEIKPHFHRPPKREIRETSEALFVRKGKVEAHIFSDKTTLAAKVMLEQGDILVLFSGGHGFKILEDAVLLEIKQGPYMGVEEKEHFPWGNE